MREKMKDTPAYVAIAQARHNPVLRCASKIGGGSRGMSGGLRGRGAPRRRRSVGEKSAPYDATPPTRHNELAVHR